MSLLSVPGRSSVNDIHPLAEELAFDKVRIVQRP